MRASLEELAAARSVKIEFFGEISDTMKWSLLRRAALVVAPSVGGESFGIVLLEAMAAGAPPLAADNPGYAQLLRDAPELLFPIRDAAALSRRMRDLLVNRDRRNALRRWGEDFHRQFEWSTVAGRIERAYREVLPAA
jgi:phosphatidyl-myo-inositol alpha-mannosyltransferase